MAPEALPDWSWVLELPVLGHWLELPILAGQRCILLPWAVVLVDKGLSVRLVLLVQQLAVAAVMGRR